MARRAASPWAWAAAALGLLHVLSALGHPFAASADEAYNLILARSLLSGAYATPLGQPVTDPLPGFPLLLAGPALILGRHWQLYRWLALAADAAALALAWRLARRLLPPPSAAAAALLTAASPVLIGQAGALLPEAFYLALSLGLLEAVASGAGPAPCAVLAALCALVRPQGALLVLPAAVFAARLKGPRRGAALAAAGLLPLAAWLLRDRLAAGTVTGYSGNWLGSLGYLDEPGGQALHWAKVSAALLGEGVLGFSGWPWPLCASLGLAALAAAGLGARRLLAGKPLERGLAFAVCAYSGLVLALHATWGSVTPRYALPLLPFAWILILAAAPKESAARPGRAAALAALLALPGLTASLRAAARGLAPAAPVWPESSAWMRERLPREARVESFACMTVMLLAERASLCPGPSPDRAAWLARLREERVGFVHLFPFQTDGYFPPALAEFAQRRAAWAAAGPELAAVYADPGEGVSLYRVVGPR